MKKIIVVDDSKIVLQSTKKVLESAGYLVKTIEDWTELISLLRQETFDLILMDVDMPGLQGDGILSAFKKSYPNIKMVFHSGKSAQELREITKLRNADGYIKKSSGKDLILKVQTYI